MWPVFPPSFLTDWNCTLTTFRSEGRADTLSPWKCGTVFHGSVDSFRVFSQLSVMTRLLQRPWHRLVPNPRLSVTLEAVEECVGVDWAQTDGWAALRSYFWTEQKGNGTQPLTPGQQAFNKRLLLPLHLLLLLLLLLLLRGAWRVPVWRPCSLQGS